jgi:outer membrane receptor protein involved in Fe transport
LQGLAGLVPSDYGYRNIGEITNQGVELALQQRRAAWNWFCNLSWQDEPEIRGDGVDPVEVNIAPGWRGNLGVGYDVRKWFWSANVNYQGEAYWADVLFARASTDAFTQVNVALGARFLDERLTLQINGANVFDESVQQHIFGDFISRKVTGQLSWRF